MDLGWASPVGVAAFFVGAGLFFWLFFKGFKTPEAPERIVAAE